MQTWQSMHWTCPQAVQGRQKKSTWWVLKRSTQGFEQLVQGNNHWLSVFRLTLGQALIFVLTSLPPQLVCRLESNCTAPRDQQLQKSNTPGAIWIWSKRDQPKAAQLAFTEVPPCEMRCTAPPSLPPPEPSALCLVLQKSFKWKHSTWKEKSFGELENVFSPCLSAYRLCTTLFFLRY